MSELKAKSEESTEASNKLIQASLLNSSVHCSYYACVQLMLHLLRTHFGKTELEVTKEGFAGAKTENGYHNWLINLIVVEFVKLNKTEASKFNSIINGLKAVRAKADYQNIKLNPNEALKACQTSERAKSLLLNIFQS